MEGKGSKIDLRPTCDAGALGRQLHKLAFAPCITIQGGIVAPAACVLCTDVLWKRSRPGKECRRVILYVKVKCGGGVVAENVGDRSKEKGARSNGRTESIGKSSGKRTERRGEGGGGGSKRVQRRKVEIQSAGRA